MDGRFERWRSTGRAVLREIRREDVTFMAASIAYHVFVSMLPILVLLTLLLTTFGSERVVTDVVELTSAVLPDSGREVVTDALVNATGSVGASVVGVGVLLWGTFKIFRAMDAAFAEMYDTERKLSLRDQFRDALVVVVVLAVTAVGAVAFGTYVTVPSVVPYVDLLDGLVAVVGLAVAFFPMYYVFPNVDVSVGEVLPGVVVAAVGWISLKWLFTLYVSLSSKPDVYGFVGTLLLLITWLYVGSLVLLVGVAVNATLAGRDGDRPVGTSGKRRFGRQVTDVDGFEHRLDALVAEARDADVPTDDLRWLLAERSAEFATGRGDTAIGRDGSATTRDEATAGNEPTGGGRDRARGGPDETGGGRDRHASGGDR